MNVNHPPSPSRSPAFTLVELLIALAVLAIISAIAVPRYRSALTNYRLSAAARRVAADLNLARESARTASASRVASFQTATGKYEIPALLHDNRRSGAYTVDLGSEPFAVRIESADFGGDASIVFDGFGMPDSAGTVVLRIGSDTRAVLVNAATGRASVQ